MERNAIVGWVSPPICGMGPADFWSAPEQKPLPAPVMTTARTSLSWLISTSICLKGSITSNAMAFIRSGRFRVTRAISGRGRSTRTKLMNPYNRPRRAAPNRCAAARAAT
ncbi:Uncharacterised protein [Mycobacteroides abscessus subsp. abscessus]|nr:Uncharacterised protein [Mycobacteroides abscessus subsp. abscessus]